MMFAFQAKDEGSIPFTDFWCIRQYDVVTHRKKTVVGFRRNNGKSMQYTI